ncbi:MAG: radical SAM protein, partial [Candidatus Zixiibacteriota bacterium]
AKFLAANGKRELILVSQEATLYGYDLPQRPHVVDLLEALSEIDGIEWLRLMYLYPGKLDDRLIEYMCADNKTLPYFDLPLQHVNTKLLAKMRRQVDKPTIEALLRQIRAAGTKTALRTTFIVGFPGESDEHFEELKAFVATWRFDRMGVFPYSAEEGTPAASMDGQIPEDVKQARCDELMALQQEIALETNAAMVGRTLEVLVDETRDDGVAVARSWADCPEIDQEVLIRGEKLEVGRFYPVRVEAVEGYDLIASQAGEGR